MWFMFTKKIFSLVISSKLKKQIKAQKNTDSNLPISSLTLPNIGSTLWNEYDLYVNSRFFKFSNYIIYAKIEYYWRISVTFNPLEVSVLRYSETSVS